MKSLRNIGSTSRLLRLESLEARRLLAAVVALSDTRLSMSPVGDASQLLADIANGTEYFSGVVDTRVDQNAPLYFSSIKQVEPHHFQIVEPVLPTQESDFLFQRARPFELTDELRAPIDIEASDFLQLNLFGDASYTSVVTSKTTNVNNTTTLVVKLQDYNFAFGYISITGSDFLVSVDIPEERAYFETRLHPQSGEMFLVQLDRNKPDVLDNYEEPLQADEHSDSRRFDDSAANPKSEPPIAKNGAPGGSGNLQSQIDVMVVYTPAAQSWSSNIDNTISTAMARSNTASTNSSLGITFNLVYSGLVNYTESGSSTDLGRLRTQFDGFLDEVHTIRNTHAADMVVILTFTNDTGGIAYLNDSRYGREDLAFSLTRVQQASSTDTFVHEIGHNMGAMHSKFQNVQAGPTSWDDWPENNWSAGWRFQGSNGNFYTTVMAYSAGQYYPDGNNAVRIPVFSDPNIVFEGQAAGDPVDGDNARSLRELRNFVGHYRDADTLLYCSASGSWSGLGITNVQLGSIDQNANSSPFYDFSFLSTDVDSAIAQQLTVSVTSPSTLNQIRVWVDWNDDKDFFDSGELIEITDPNAVLQYVIPVAAPPGTLPGQKRMRIRLHQPNLGGNISPCGVSSSGKVLDFKLNMAAPASQVVGSSVYHAAWTGSIGGASDSVKVLAKESQTSQALGLLNLINTSQGINGLRFDIDGLPVALSTSDFVFQWSPQGTFVEGSNPPANWQTAPSPSSINSTLASPSQVLMQWPDGTIMNRWLRITILSNTNTGLSEPEVYYVGHLLGETTGPTAGVFTVSFADIAEIRGAVGQTVDSSNVWDVDKSGIVAFSDINAMRQNVGGQLPAITVAATGGGGSGAEFLAASGAPPVVGGVTLADERNRIMPRATTELVLDHALKANFIDVAGTSKHVSSVEAGWLRLLSLPPMDTRREASDQSSVSDEAVRQLGEEAPDFSFL